MIDPETLIATLIGDDTEILSQLGELLEKFDYGVTLYKLKPARVAMFRPNPPPPLAEIPRLPEEERPGPKLNTNVSLDHPDNAEWLAAFKADMDKVVQRKDDVV